MSFEAFERSPMRILIEHHGGLSPGQVGLIIARVGVGKSALLVHIGLESLMHERRVLHISLRETVDHVRMFYDEIFGALARTKGLRERAAAMLAAERHRMIHSYLDKSFSLTSIRQSLSMLAEVAQFIPELVLIDGLDSHTLQQQWPELEALAIRLQMPIWVTVKTLQEDLDAVDAWVSEHAVRGLRLIPEDRTVRIALLRDQGEPALPLPLLLDPTTMMISGENEGETAVLTNLRPTDATVYSGGAHGAEAEFGLQAEAWGVNEVNFTFDGHSQVRGRGRYQLSPRELAAGDVSLVYVSRRLNRTYSEGSLIRRVLQTIWHMVSRSQQVFVIGSIQEDGTVKGGTGWSVELARMWNKNLWVFDQDKGTWYRWEGQDWSVGTPVIDSIHFTGTGTRYLNDEGKRAIQELFERSFARRVDAE